MANWRSLSLALAGAFLLGVAIESCGASARSIVLPSTTPARRPAPTPTAAPSPSPSPSVEVIPARPTSGTGEGAVDGSAPPAA